MGKKERHGEEFYKGVKEVELNKSKSDFVYQLYPRAKELSKFGDSLDEREKGYVVGVANNLMKYSGRALDAAKLYSSVGELDSGAIKAGAVKALLKDARRGPNVKYRSEISDFMNSHNLAEEANSLPKFTKKPTGKNLPLEMEVVDSREKRRGWRIVSSLFIFLGFVLSGFSLPGNVIGSVDSGFGFFGAGFFVLGLAGFLISRKY